MHSPKTIVMFILFFYEVFAVHILCFHLGCCWLYCPGRAWFVMVSVSFRDIKQAILL